MDTHGTGSSATLGKLCRPSSLSNTQFFGKRTDASPTSNHHDLLDIVVMHLLKTYGKLEHKF